MTCAVLLLGSVMPFVLVRDVSASVQETHLYPVADAMCDSANPSTNYGSQQTWKVGYYESGNSIRKSYLTFDVRSLNLSAIVNATLVLRCYAEMSVLIDVNECEDYWFENYICWDTAPFLQDKIGELNVWINGFHEQTLNVTEAVKNETDGYFSIVFTNQTELSGNAMATFYAREYTSLTPYLKIYYEAGAGPAPSGGEWTLTGISGNWSYSTDPLLLAGEGWNADTAFANFTHGNLNKTFADGEGFQIDFTVSITGDRREWWWWEGTKRFYFSFGLHGTGGAAYSLFYIAHEQGILITTSEAIVGTQRQYNVGKPFLQIGETVDTTEAVWYIQFIRVNSTTAKVIYATNLFSGNEAALNVTEGAIKTFTETITVDPSVWNNPELVLYAGHDGSGTFQIAYGELYIGTITVLEDQTPPGLNPNPFQWIMDGFNFLYSLVVIVGAFAGQFLPILPFIFLFYVLDVVVSSVMHGNVKLIGDFALKIWDFLRELWDTLVNFGRLIWDTITFWT